MDQQINSLLNRIAEIERRFVPSFPRARRFAFLESKSVPPDNSGALLPWQVLAGGLSSQEEAELQALRDAVAADEAELQRFEEELERREPCEERIKRLRAGILRHFDGFASGAESVCRFIAGQRALVESLPHHDARRWDAEIRLRILGRLRPQLAALVPDDPLVLDVELAPEPEIPALSDEARAFLYRQSTLQSLDRQLRDLRTQLEMIERTYRQAIETGNFDAAIPWWVKSRIIQEQIAELEARRERIGQAA